MNLPDILLTKEECASAKFNECISSVSEKECHSYSQAFSNCAIKAKDSKDESGFNLFALLSAVTSFNFMPESNDSPFGPFFEMAGSRGLMPSDLTKYNLESLEQIVEIVEDPELKARICDVLWIAEHKYNYAEMAIPLYIESAKTLENPDMWPPCQDRIERALRLAISINNKPLKKSVVQHIEDLLAKYNGEDPLFLSAKLMENLLEIGEGDPDKYIKISSTAVKKSIEDKNLYKAREYLRIKSRWLLKQDKKDESDEALVQEAETYIQEAEESISSQNPSYMQACHSLEQAIEAFRRIGGKQDRVDETHRKLLDYQKNIHKEMQHVSHSIDLSELITSSIKRVKNKNFEEALRSLAFCSKSPDIKELRKRVEGLIKSHPVQFLFSSIGVTKEGKVISRREGFTGAEDGESVIRAAMYEQIQIENNITAQGMIDPARRQILTEHRGSMYDFATFVRNNPFIPPGREYLYARALSAGLRGDFIEFLSIAAPQVENSIRYLLAQRGVPTSGIDAEGIQREFDLNRLLFMPEVIDILGDDLCFDMQGLLVIPAGLNLRNRLAHGLLEFDNFYMFGVLYFWWLVLRIIFLGILMIEKSSSSAARKA